MTLTTTQRPPAWLTEAERRSVLAGLGADAAVAEAVLRYAGEGYDLAAMPSPLVLPPPPEPHLAVWERYAADTAGGPVWDVLRARLPQLRFPIAEGISATEPYRAATLRGATGGESMVGVELEHPEGLRLLIHPTVAGPVPLLVPEGRRDFVTLVQALARRNEPSPVPASMGACMVSGYNNWERIRTHRTVWETEHPAEAEAGGWAEEFRRFTGEKGRYQDTFIIVSDGPYSGVTAFDLHLPDAEWVALSPLIRCEHESVHYVTRRLLGGSRNHLLDEIVADYASIVAATGTFRPGWLLLFLGLEHLPAYRAGGRFENYLGVEPLDETTLTVLRALVAAAIAGIARFHTDVVAGYTGAWARGRAVLALASMSLIDLASTDAPALLRDRWTAIEESVA